MTIPADEILQDDLLTFLAAEPEARAPVRRVYEQLALCHPDVTEAERTQKYRNSLSLWANRVQFARLHLVNRGLLYRANEAPDTPRGYWKLTPKGIEKGIETAKNVQSESTKRQVEADLEALASEEAAIEGVRTKRLVAHFERNPKLRGEAVVLHGTKCVACGFDFAATYGPDGHGYIEVHHLVPVSRMTQPSAINPKTDMTVLCSNCHRMIHRNPHNPLSMQQLVAVIQKHRNEA